MSPYEMLDAGISAGTRVDVQWGLFVTVHFAILGGIAYVERPLRVPEKIGGMIVYLAFATVSYRATRFHMSVLQNAYKDFADAAANGPLADLHLVEFITQDLLSGRFEFANFFAIAAYVTMAALVALALIFDVELTAHVKNRE